MITYIIRLQNGKTIEAVGHKEKIKALKENHGSNVSSKVRDDSNNPPVVRHAPKPAPAPMVEAPKVEPGIVEDTPPVVMEEKPAVVESKEEEKKPVTKKKRSYTKKKTTVKKAPVKKKEPAKKSEEKEEAPEEGSYEWFVSQDKK